MTEFERLQQELNELRKRVAVLEEWHSRSLVPIYQIVPNTPLEWRSFQSQTCDQMNRRYTPCDKPDSQSSDWPA